MMPEQNPDEVGKLINSSATSEEFQCPLTCPNRRTPVEQQQARSKAGGLVASFIAIFFLVLMAGQVFQYKNGTIETRDDPNVVVMFGLTVATAVFAGVSLPPEILAFLARRIGVQ